MKVQIHKNYFKTYHRRKWEDVPEFILFETLPSNFVSVTFDDDDEIQEILGNA